ncbi:hypothetical protein HanPI659440_Chr11g0414511 [Helianthus annuus]|nr:hypothetical protein HanPI659440_Chr11g0414511 [Helianthus annuus]
MVVVYLLFDNCLPSALNASTPKTTTGTDYQKPLYSLYVYIHYELVQMHAPSRTTVVIRCRVNTP